MSAVMLAAAGTAARATRGESLWRGVSIFMPSANSWYVQTVFGAVLGPMPDDTLAEMARTGALLPEDRVRKGADGDWRLASTVPDLFDDSSGGTGTTSGLAFAESGEANGPAAARVIKAAARDSSISSLSTRFEKQNPIRTTLTAVHSASQTIQDHEHSLPELKLSTADTATDVSGNATEEPLCLVDAGEPGNSPGPLGNPPRSDVDLIESWKAERRHTHEQLGLSSLAAENVTDIGAALDAPDESLPDLLVFESHNTESMAIGEPKSPSPSIKRTSLLSQIAPRPQNQETFPQKWDRWKRSLPSWPIAIACVAVLAMIWWYWPRSSRGIYDRYVAIWNELRTRRNDFKDKEGWDEFLERSKADINEVVPWLEERASSRDQEKQLLLWIGRDCLRPMLKRPRVVDSAEEKQLRQHLNLLSDLYFGTTSTEPRAAHVGPDGKSPAETDPE